MYYPGIASHISAELGLREEDEEELVVLKLCNRSRAAGGMIPHGFVALNIPFQIDLSKNGGYHNLIQFICGNVNRANDDKLLDFGVALILDKAAGKPRVRLLLVAIAGVLIVPLKDLEKVLQDSLQADSPA